MLRLSRERILVWLGLGEVAWLKVSAGLKPTVLAKHTVRVDPHHGEQPWQAAVAALRSDAEGWRKDRIAVTIVLSNNFVRYAVVPPSDNVNGAEEEFALARFYFSKVHGERSSSWDVRLSDNRGMGSKLACALDADLIPALRACFGETGQPRLVSVQPLLMSVFNCWRHRLPKNGAWLLLIEPERACLALHSGRDWIAAQNAKGDYTNIDAWIDLLDRERWGANMEVVPDTVLIHASRLSDTALTDHGAWKLLGLRGTWPEGLSPLEDTAYAPALTVL